MSSRRDEIVPELERERRETDYYLGARSPEAIAALSGAIAGHEILHQRQIEAAIT